MNVRESFAAQLMGVNATLTRGGTRMGGFLAKTSGAISITDGAGTLIVDTVPVTAGTFTPIPIMFQQGTGFTAALSGGASGTLLI